MRINGLTSKIGARTPGFLTRLPKAPVASAISGLIVAALILMTPNEIFEAIVIQTGLPAMLAAAEPPLGATARIVTAAIFAAVIALVAWAALSVMLRERGRDVEEIDDGLPRLRRADAHPDAPPRRPIFAHDDLGAPLDLADGDADLARERVVKMRARFADPQPDAPEWREAVDQVPADVPGAAEPEPMELGVEAIIWEPEPPAPPATEDAAPPPPETPVFVTPLRHPELEPEPQSAPEPVARAAAPFESRPDPAPAPRPRFDPEAIQTLSTLVDRLELGLARRRGAARAMVAAPANVAVHPLADRGGDGDMDGALRDALDALQRLRG